MNLLNLTDRRELRSKQRQDGLEDEQQKKDHEFEDAEGWEYEPFVAVEDDAPVSFEQRHDEVEASNEKQADLGKEQPEQVEEDQPTEQQQQAEQQVVEEQTEEQGVAVADQHVVEEQTEEQQEQQGQAHDETEEGGEQSHDDTEAVPGLEKLVKAIAMDAGVEGMEEDKSPEAAKVQGTKVPDPSSLVRHAKTRDDRRKRSDPDFMTVDSTPKKKGRKRAKVEKKEDKKDDEEYIDVEEYERCEVVDNAKKPEVIMQEHVGRRDYAGRELLHEADQRFIDSFIDRGYKE